jgi:hypothetical protein
MQKLEEIIWHIKFWFFVVCLILGIISMLVILVNVAFFGGSMPRRKLDTFRAATDRLTMSM